MEARQLAIVLAMLVAATSGAQAWSQVGGGSSRDEPAFIPGGALDVVEWNEIGESPGAFWTPAVLPTRDAFLAYLDGEDGSCALVRYATPMEARGTTISERPCEFGNLVAYDAATDTVVLCHQAVVAEAVLEARDATSGELRWDVVPSRDLAVDPIEERGYCLSAALDETTREVVAPVMGCCASAPARLVSIDVDSGGVRWMQRVPTGPAAPVVGPVMLPQTLVQGFESYHGITLTTTGIVLSGYYGCDLCEEGILAWADREGTLIGKERAVTGEPDQVETDSFERTRGVSQYAVASGPLAASVLGEDVVLVNPQLTAPVMRARIEAVSPNTFSAFIQHGHWRDGDIIATLGTSFTAFDGATLEQRWSWSAGLDHIVTDSVRTQSGDIVALLQRYSDDATLVVVIDGDQGRTRWTMALPIQVPVEQRNGYDAHLIPLGDRGLLVVDEIGRRVLLAPAPAEELPLVTIEPEYPAPGDEVRVRVRGPAGADVARMVLATEGGEVNAIPSNGEATLIFPERGDREVRVTAVLADGRTRTASATVHVGGTPPAELTAIQRAFSAEYQNWTFFVIGTLITVIGLAVTVGRNRRRFTKLERELAAVEEIRMLSVADPRAAVLALKSYRDRLPEDLARRRIDDSQYQILDLRSARLLKVLRTRMLSPFDARLSVRYHRLLDAAFEDAILQPSEKIALLASLDAEEMLTAADRAAIAGILDDFTSVAVRA